jgi:hypothetical protein
MAARKGRGVSLSTTIYGWRPYKCLKGECHEMNNFFKVLKNKKALMVFTFD